MDSGVTIDVGLGRHVFRDPQFASPAGGLGIRTKDIPLEKERRLRQFKLPAALAWARANGIDRVVLPANRPRLGIVCQGQAYKDVIEAFAAMGIGFPEAAALGISIYKVGMPWPLEPQGLRAFAAGLETLMVIEHKRGLIEPQARAALYDLPAHARPRIIGKTDEKGAPLLADTARCRWRRSRWRSSTGCRRAAHGARARYLDRVSRPASAAVSLSAEQVRKPFFCSGCPHNSSTKLPEGRARWRDRLPLHGQLQRSEHRHAQPDGRRGPGLDRRRAVHGRAARVRQPRATAPTTTPARWRSGRRSRPRATSPTSCCSTTPSP
jgi:indolepyruvate ferredoxin oxidoreductase